MNSICRRTTITDWRRHGRALVEDVLERKERVGQRSRQGETLDQIARALHRGSSSIYEYAEDGIAPRSRLALTTTDREEISRHLARGLSVRAISRARSSAVDDQPIGREKSRPCRLSCGGGRSPCAATRTTSQTVPAGGASDARSSGRDEARASVVPSANLRLASRDLSE